MSEPQDMESLAREVVEEMARKPTTSWQRLQLILSALQKARKEGLEEAVRLATIIWRTEYRDEAPDWKPLDYVAGVISQIDNMFAGVRAQRDSLRQQLAQAKQAHWETADKLGAVESGLTQAHEQLAQRDAEIKQLTADKERLDWLIKQGPPGATEGIGLNDEAWSVAYGFADGDQNAVRAAIDAARLSPSTESEWQQP